MEHLLNLALPDRGMFDPALRERNLGITRLFIYVKEMTGRCMPIGENMGQWREDCELELRQHFFYTERSCLEFIDNDSGGLGGIMDIACEIYDVGNLKFDADVPTMFNVCMKEMWEYVLNEVVSFENVRRLNELSARLELN